MVDYKLIIEKLNLQPLSVEGGYFNKIITLRNGNEQLASCIYYLITPDSFSSLHKVLKDEFWYFLEGDPLTQITIDDDKNMKSIELGRVSEGYCAVSLVNKNIWQATKLKDGGSWALVATTVVPGFSESDFISYDENVLTKFKSIDDINLYIY